MSNQNNIAALNITLSYGNVSFRLTPSSTRDRPTSSPPQTSQRTNASYAAHRKRQHPRRSGSGRAAAAVSSQQQPHRDSSPPIVAIRRGSSPRQPAAPDYYSSPTTAPGGSSPRNRSPLQRHILGRVRSMRDAFESQHEGGGGKTSSSSSAPQAARSPLFSPRDSIAGDYCVDLRSFTGTLHISSSSSSSSSSHDAERPPLDARENGGGGRFDSPLLSPRKRAAATARRGDEDGDDRRFGLPSKRARSLASISREEDGGGSGGRASRRTNGSKKAVRFSMNSSGGGGSSSSAANLPNSTAKSKAFAFSGDVATGRTKGEADAPDVGPNATRRRDATEDVDRNAMQSTQQTKTQFEKPKGAKSLSLQSFSSPPRDALATTAQASMNIARETSSVLARSSKHFLKQITLAGKDAYDVVLSGDIVAPASGAAADSNLNSPNNGQGGNGATDPNGGNDDAGEYDAPDGTELHYACASDNLDHVRSLLEYDSLIDLHTADCNGKLPIHVFTENAKLVEKDPAGCEEAAFAMIRFMGPDRAVEALHPSGLAPFVSVIAAWTERAHRGAIRARASGVVSRGANFLASGAALLSPTASGGGPPSNAAPERPDGEDPRTAASASNDARSRRRRVAYRSLFHSSASADRSSPTSSGDRAKLLYLPTSVATSDHVRWAIRVLSRLIDEDYPERVREAVLTNMACVPLFLKSLLLIDDADEMAELLDTSLAKRVASDRRSIDVWLCAMLTGPREAKARAVTFLMFLSQLTLESMAATSRRPDRHSDEEAESFARLREDTFDAISRTPGIVPAVLGLGGQMIESLSTTRVMRYITDKTIRKESVFFVLICDFFYSIFLLIGYRLNVEFVLSYQSVDGPGHYGEGSYIPTSTMGIACYFLVKEAMTLLSLYLTSKKLAKRYCLSVFNIIDVAAVVMLLGTDSALSHDPTSLDNEGYAAGITIILLWLKLMGAFKILNGAFALFLYAVNEVIKEVKWFLLFLFMVVLMFSDAARTVVAARRDCQQIFDVADDAAASTTAEFCSENWSAVVMRMYAVLAGDVALEYFESSDAMLVLFVFFSFFSIIILLNILIAIIIDSYEGSKQRSREIFYRARIEYAARLVARKQFLRDGDRGDLHVGDRFPRWARRALRPAYRLVSAAAAAAFEYGFFGAIYFLALDSDDGTIRLLMSVFVCVGAIFNLYAFSYAAIALLSAYEKRLGGTTNRPEAEGDGRASPRGVVAGAIGFLDVAVTLLYRLLGFNADRSDVSEEYLISDEEK